jgi:Fe-S-cluster containining protein
MILIICPNCGAVPVPINPNVRLEAMEELVDFKQIWEQAHCRRCGANLTVRDETNRDRVAEYIELFSALDPNYKSIVAALSLLDFFTTYEEKRKTGEFLDGAKLKDGEDVEGKVDIVEVMFKQSQKRAAERYEAYLRLGGGVQASRPAFTAKPESELSLLERGGELLRRAVSGDGAVLMNLIVSPQDPIRLQLLRHAVFMQMMPNLCEGCSQCCENIKTIQLDRADVERIAAHLKMPRAQFEARYVRNFKDEDDKVKQTFKRTAPCTWLKDGRCAIYAVRPNVCVFYPFLTDVQRPGDSTTIIVPGFCKSALGVIELLQGKEGRMQLEEGRT